MSEYTKIMTASQYHKFLANIREWKKPYESGFIPLAHKLETMPDGRYKITGLDVQEDEAYNARKAS